MRIGLLTSSRADYGIYLPLIQLLNKDPEIKLDLLVFGTHLSDKFGKTIDNIRKDGFKNLIEVNTLIDGDGPKEVTLSIAKTIAGFTGIWQNYHFDLVFALGDRYEMFAAVASSVPFNINVAHIHGGETTLGAIDNVFRHSISCMSKLHFTTTEFYRNRVKEITGSYENVYNVGALSIDAMKQMRFLSIADFKIKYGIDLSRKTILITFHPETINYENNSQNIKELVSALSELKDYQQVITMPNADTMGIMVREELVRYAEKRSNVFCIESFGSLGYLSCMKHCAFMLGNTSSGFVEASFFPKYVINTGKRQEGRLCTRNIINCNIKKEEILVSINKLGNNPNPELIDIYGDGNAAKQIRRIIKNQFRTE